MVELIQLADSRDKGPLPLATRKRNLIRNTQRLPKAKEATRKAHEEVSHAHPFVRLRSLSSTYNCAGLVFANRRTFVEMDDVSLILKDDGYKKISRQLLMAGDIVLYKDESGGLTHVAVVVANEPGIGDVLSITVLSQWGATGEYLHRLADVPDLLGTPQDFMSERES